MYILTVGYLNNNDWFIDATTEKRERDCRTYLRLNTYRGSTLLYLLFAGKEFKTYFDNLPVGERAISKEEFEFVYLLSETDEILKRDNSFWHNIFYRIRPLSIERVTSEIEKKVLELNIHDTKIWRIYVGTRSNEAFNTGDFQKH